MFFSSFISINSFICYIIQFFVCYSIWFFSNNIILLFVRIENFNIYNIQFFANLNILSFWNEASTWSSYLIKLPDPCTWLHFPRGWHDATKSLLSLLLLLLSSTQLPPSFRLLTDQTFIKTIVANCYWV